MKKILIMIIVLSLAVLMVNCSDFLTGGILDMDPNRPDVVPTMSLFVALQPMTYGFYVGDVGVYSSLFMQQIAGVGHQYEAYEVYQLTNADFSGFMQLYQEGGLIDIKTLKARAEEEGRSTLLGLTKIHEAMMFATGADAWGDLPYSEAVTDGVEHPKYDTQDDVHKATLTLLDGAISDLQKGGSFDASYDFALGGDLVKWIAVAHTLKARILLNWGEVKSGNYALALAEAQQGISSTEGNWIAPFQEVNNEENIYYQFLTYRGHYINAGRQIVDMLKATNDPRVEFYFGKDEDGGYSGSAHAEYNEGASWLNTATYGNRGWDLDMLTYEENRFIIAECQYNAGTEPEALATLNAVLGAIETRWGFDANSIQRYSDISGVDLLKAIIEEKYKALFLNQQVWNDWKRTGFPEISSNAPGLNIPRRLMYPEDEKNSNESFPGVKGLWVRNQNDPGEPVYLSIRNH